MSYFEGLEPSFSQPKRSWPFQDEERVLEQDQAPGLSFAITPQSEESEQATPSQASSNEICFGCLVEVNAQCRNLPPYRPDQPRSGSERLFLAFDIAKEGDFFSLECQGDRFARLSKASCSTLRTLKDMKVRLQACLEWSEWNKARNEWTQKRTQSLISVDVNIYGLEQDAEAVGKILSKARIYLQAPRHRPEETKYMNPHFLQIDGFSDEVRLEQNTTKPIDSTPVQRVQPQVEEETDMVNESAEVDLILNSLSHHVPLANVTVDSHIKSNLLAHQKEAIDFMSSRELGDVPEELSLWDYNETDGDEPFFKHVFTGAKRPQREEARGGIIADEMGLGKSLMVLSIVAGSLERAEKFVLSERELLSDQSLKKVPTRATLILAPSSLLIDSWADEIAKHTYPGGLPFHRHLGKARFAEQEFLQSKAIVFTTYATVAAEFCRGENTLAKYKWFRIVLDEAHDIRNRSTKQYQAVSSLSAEHRWCLSGTPIQNSLEDLGALVSFLKVPILENPQTFRKLIISTSTSKSKTRFKNLQTLLQTICIRRTRELLSELQEPVSQLRRLPLSPSEQLEYQNLVQKCRKEIDMAVSGRGKGRINSIVLESLLALRLFCNNGSANAIIRTDSSGIPSDGDEALSYLQQQDRNICAYCGGTIYSLSDATGTDGGIFIGSCHHLVCRNCMPHHRTQKGACPSCVTGNDATVLGVGPTASNLHSTNAADMPWPRRLHDYPSKLLAFLADIQRDPTHKSIVFSSWKKTLKLVAELLGMHGIRFNLIDGSLSLNDRLRVLKDFRSPLGANVLLMTLGTGAVGLNLAVASRIYLLEPQWNPSIESQAIGRALRLGQTDQVVIIKYVMMQTVEESNVLDRQRSKLQLAGGGFNKAKSASSERLQSMLDFFGIVLT